MNQLEENVVNSFRLAKRDIISLQRQVNEISQAQERIVEILTRSKEVKKTNGKVHRKAYVASKEATKFHIEACPFAHNIKPKNKIKFKSRVKALNEGFKPCECV